MRLFLKEICDRLFSFSNSISQISSFRAKPLVYLRRKRFPMAMMANSTKKLIGLMPLRLRQPRQMGLEVEASVPTAETIPAPIPLALEGQSSQKQTWKKQKKKETHPLKMNTMMISKMLWMQRSHSSGFSINVSRSAQTPDIKNMMIPVILLGIFSMRKKEGMKVTISDMLTRQLLTQMSNPISSIMSAGPQYMAQVINEMMLQVIVMTLRLENLQRSIGVMYLSLKSQVIWQSITFWMSYSSRMFSWFLFMRPIRFKAFFVTVTPFLIRNCGVYSMQKIRSSSSMMAGTATRQIQLILQESITEKKKVMIIAPNVKKICTKTEYFCLRLSPTTSPKKKKQILMAASHPHPLKNNPTATMQIFTLQATITVPRVHMAQETTIDDFLPKLSEKKEMAMYPMNAPKQVLLLTRSIMADLLQRQLSSVASEVKSRSQGSMNRCH